MTKMDGIIFDMDGTMWDTVDDVVASWNEVIKEHGYDKVITREEMQSCMGLLMGEITDRMLPMVSEEDKEQIRNDICQKENEHLSTHGGKLYPGLVDTLEYLSKKYKLFIVSNCQDGYIQSFYSGNGLEKYFKDYECAGATGLGKMENILLLAHRNNLRSYAYIGDTQTDMKAAKGAAATFVYARYGFGDVDEDDCDMVIDSLSELKELF